MFDRQDAGIEEYLRPSELIGLDWIGFTDKRLAITLENVIPTNVIGRLFIVSWAIYITARCTILLGPRI